jgi:hypothetical protein
LVRLNEDQGFSSGGLMQSKRICLLLPITYYPFMPKALTVTQARSKLGRLLDQAARGKSVYLKRGGKLLRIDRVTNGKPIPEGPLGYFKFDDELTTLTNRAEPSFTPLDEN